MELIFPPNRVSTEKKISIFVGDDDRRFFDIDCVQVHTNVLFPAISFKDPHTLTNLPRIMSPHPRSQQIGKHVHGVIVMSYTHYIITLNSPNCTCYFPVHTLRVGANGSNSLYNCNNNSDISGGRINQTLEYAKLKTTWF